MDSNRLRELAVSDTGFVFDPYSGFTFSVNPTGRFILEQLKTGLGVDEVVTRLREGFETQPSDDPARDVNEFILMLRENGLLPRDEHAAS
ncbi:MAG: PqqD family protein [Myxococcales bacterium]|nr:PqqD family protein [Myxococcales bacterium]